MRDDTDLISIDPIGVVHSPVMDRREMPVHGVRAEVEVFPRFQDGLLLIEGNTHLWITAWLNDVERRQLQIVRPEYRSGQRRRGVFGLRSTTRPNSIALCVSRLVEVRDRTLVLDNLDFLDGSAVLDIRRYSPSWDAVFSALSSREVMIEPVEAANLTLLELDGERFHGSLTPGVVAIARLVQQIMLQWNVVPRHPGLSVSVPESGQPGACIDAIQGMTAATFGTGRLRTHSRPGFTFRFDGQSLNAIPQEWDGLELEQVRNAPLESLFRIEE